MKNSAFLTNTRGFHRRKGEIKGGKQEKTRGTEGIGGAGEASGRHRGRAGSAAYGDSRSGEQREEAPGPSCHALGTRIFGGDFQSVSLAQDFLENLGVNHRFVYAR